MLTWPMPRLDAIGLGHITCDIICPLDGWPQRDTKTVLPALTLAGGGPSANAMAALAKLDVACAVAGRLGDDVLGRFTHEAHARDGLDVSHVQLRPDCISPVSVILSDLRESTRTILLTKGENTQLPPEELDWDWLHQARVLHLDGHQVPASLALARAARGWDGVQVVLDAGSLREGMLELCALADYAIASQRFARDLTGSDDPQRCIEQLLQLGARAAGVTLGAQGSVLVANNTLYRHDAFVVPTQDTTGAGDAFHGGFIYGLLHGLGPQQCLRTASAVAAIKCTGLGARSALPSAQALAQFLHMHAEDSINNA
jgi:sulfofructose kinase